jgi:catechol 2,3-dioxygenase-like lactoylglutathione lyase family enzyme
MLPQSLCKFIGLRAWITGKSNMSRPINVKKIDHLVLRVADFDQARFFYETVLGCELERSLPDLGLYQFRAGHQLIDLVTVGSKLGGDEPVSETGSNQDHFCLAIEPFVEDELRAYLSEFGIDCPEAGERYGADGFGPSVYIRDPDGNVVELKGPAT